MPADESTDQEENLWEAHYQDGHTPWDKGEPSPGLVDYLSEKAAEISGRILVPGCGLGHDVRALTAALIDADVLGLDIAPSAVAAAEALPKVGRERFEVGDWFNLTQSQRGAFDWIWEHTCFCAIDPNLREAYVVSAASALRPGGTLLGVFYLDPYDEEHTPGEGPPHGCEEAELKALFGTRFELQERWVPERTYPGREGRELMMRWVLRGDTASTESESG